MACTNVPPEIVVAQSAASIILLGVIEYVGEYREPQLTALDDVEQATRLLTRIECRQVSATRQAGIRCVYKQCQYALLSRVKQPRDSSVGLHDCDWWCPLKSC